jgi:thiol-disulfide isomerase/thioredoxin
MLRGKISRRSKGREIACQQSTQGNSRMIFFSTRNRRIHRTMKSFLGHIIVMSLFFGALPAGRCANEEAAEIDWAAHNITVVLFILHDCPICNSYVPEMNRIAEEYGRRGFAFIAAYADSGFSQEEAQEHAREYGLRFPFVIDSDHNLAARTGTKVVPEAVVFNSKREILYRGRIDDLYADIDKRRPAAQERSLREALEDIVAGRKPKRLTVPGVGCPIEPGKS